RAAAGDRIRSATARRRGAVGRGQSARYGDQLDRAPGRCAGPGHDSGRFHRPWSRGIGGGPQGDGARGPFCWRRGRAFSARCRRRANGMKAPRFVRPNVVDDALDLIGRTPLIRLAKLSTPGSATIYGKLESQNPGGSVKDRPALAMVTAAEKA